MSALTIIDTTTHDAALIEAVCTPNWLERVGTITGSVAALVPGSTPDPLRRLKTLRTWNEVIDFAAANDHDTVVLVGADQLFVDATVAREGLQNAGTSWDYFTQWEFSRLPVGVGIRALRLSDRRISGWTGDPESLIDKINSLPGQFGLRYETKAYTTYEESLLDSRFNAHIGRALGDVTAPDGPPLQAFLSLATKASDRGALRYKTDKPGIRFDERLMPVPFGFESKECAEFPTYIMFDMSNKCNAFCAHCPQGIPEFRAKIGAGIFLAPDRFRSVVDQCVGKTLDFVRITADGEPLMHPHLMDLIGYCAERGVGPVGLTTNGSLLKEPKIRELVQSGLFMVDFSLDAIRPDTYAVVRKGLAYDRVMSNVKRVVEVRDELGSALKVMVSFVKQPLNLAELQEFESFWSGIVDKVLIREMISNVGYNEVDEADGPDFGKTGRWPCPHWFRRAVVNYDGRLKACPIDWDNALAYRSVDEVTIHDTWHSDYYWDHRIQHLNNEFSSDSICGPCHDWKGTPWDLGYEKVMKTLKVGQGDMGAFVR